MKITEVDAALMSFPMPEPIELPFHGGRRTIVKRDAMFIRVTTDTGLRGYAPGPAHETAVKDIAEKVRPFLLGKDPRGWSELVFDADLATNKTYHAVEIALMDLHSRFEGCALSEVIGGRVRDSIKLYGSAGMYMAPEAFAEEAAAIQAMGFPAYKMRPALGMERDIETVRRMREATGPDFGLMIDAHSWWRMGDLSFTEAQVNEAAAAIAEFRPTWLEEPIPPADHAAYRALRAAGHVPVASGEHEQTLEGFLDLIESGGVDVAQMDVCCQGGFAMGKRVFQAVREKGIRFAFHSWGHTLEVLAAAHLGVCEPESVVEWLEYPCYSREGRAGMYPCPLAEEILVEPLAIEGGYLHMPDGPGLGIEIDESVVDRYPFIPGPWSFFHLDSPRETVAVTGDHSVTWVEGEES